jgi:hypothetical protein
MTARKIQVCPTRSSRRKNAATRGHEKAITSNPGMVTFATPLMVKAYPEHIIGLIFLKT